MAAELASVVHELKKEQVAEWIQRAERLVSGRAIYGCPRSSVAVVEGRQPALAGRQLIAQVQQNLNMRQRAEQIRQLRVRAEAAASDKRYDEAINSLQEACGLEPSNSELAELLETARREEAAQRND